MTRASLVTTRRTVLGLGAAVASAPLLTGAATAVESDPFTLGVASGDPTPDGVVLWTRLATNPLAADGLGGMVADVEVAWEVARDAAFTRVVARGTETATRTWGHSVHVELTGMPAATELHYRFRAGGFISPVGRTRTAPAAGSLTPLRLAVASCAQWEHGFFTAYRHLADDAPDLVVHLGDYIYEHGPLGYPVSGGRARPMVGGETSSLADYRRRHALYKTDPDLQHAHASAPWVVVFDDHEVDNDWADEYHEVWGRIPSFMTRRAAAFRAYYENMPLRRSALPSGPDMQLYRRLAWGDTVNLHMLDTRQYRSDQTCGGRIGPCTDAANPARTITGAEQEAWLLGGLAASRARWDVLGQQVMFAQYDLQPGAGFVTNMDAWDGYLASKARVMQGLVDASVRNPLVLTGDVHESFANDLWRQRDGRTEVLGSELVTTSITSGGDAGDTQFAGDPDNPHIRYHETMRGYLTIDFSATLMRADFRVVDRVRTRGGAVRTDASFVLEDGQRGLARA